MHEPISVVIPLYNKGPYISRTMESVLNQSHTDIRVVVVNDGSTDQGPEIVGNIDDERVLLIHQENKGPGSARNKGLEHVKTDLVAFLDADDEWMPNFLETMCGIMRQHDVASASSGFYLCPVGKSSKDIFPEFNSGSHAFDEDANPDELIRAWRFISPCSTLIKSDVVRKYGGYYDKDHVCNGEDGHFQLKLLMNEKVYILNEPLVAHHADASDLYIPFKINGPIPLPAFLLEPEDILRYVSEEKLALANDVLFKLSLQTARHYANRGDYKNAMGLMKRYSGWSNHRSDYSKTMLHIGLSPFLPVIRHIYYKFRK